MLTEQTARERAETLAAIHMAYAEKHADLEAFRRLATDIAQALLAVQKQTVEECIVKMMELQHGNEDLAAKQLGGDNYYRDRAGAFEDARGHLRNLIKE